MATSNNTTSIAAPAFLLLCGLVGFILANSPLSQGYKDLLLTPVNIEIGGYSLISKSLLLLINDGLMAIFFLFVGLELKREVIVGELSRLSTALLPAIAAVGGMLVPALFYTVVAGSGEAARGWGIPMATDIAFALGLLATLGNRVPAALKVLLAAIAIVDDLGAILVIAVFYTEQIDLTMLAWALAAFGVLIAMNRLGVKKLALYVVTGIPLWYFMLKSGIHATIAGVLIATTIPLASRGQSKAKVIDDILEDKRSPLDSPAVFLEKSLLPWVAFLVVPVFAFANAGVSLLGASFGTVSLGIFLGLVFGKPLGIVGAAYTANRLGFAALPANVTWRDMTGLGFLAGVGFTMSLFIGSLAFSDASLHSEAKLAVLVSSLVAGVVGVCCFFVKKGR